MSLHSQQIYVAPSPIGGRGVFTSKKIYAGDLIEVCPAIVMKPGDIEYLDKTALYDYYFLWEDESQNLKTTAIALGLGSMYNHAAPSNADYQMDFEHHTIDIIAVENIEPGQEITINYNGDPNNTDPTWFMESEPK